MAENELYRHQEGLYIAKLIGEYENAEIAGEVMGDIYRETSRSDNDFDTCNNTPSIHECDHIDCNLHVYEDTVIVATRNKCPALENKVEVQIIGKEEDRVRNVSDILQDRTETFGRPLKPASLRKLARAARKV